MSYGQVAPAAVSGVWIMRVVGSGVRCLGGGQAGEGTGGGVWGGRASHGWRHPGAAMQGVAGVPAVAGVAAGGGKGATECGSRGRHRKRVAE
jgi:hypothetical protein